MRNRPLYKKFKAIVDAQGLSLTQLQALEIKDIVELCDLSAEEEQTWSVYANGIKSTLIKMYQEEIERQEKAVMVDKLRKAGTNITLEETELAVDAVFEHRAEKSVIKEIL